MKKLVNFVKGIVIGIATLVPGVSGGTMAIILGLYDEMIHAISSFFKDIKKHTVFLLTVGLGGIVGIIGFSRIVDYGLNNFKMPMVYLFLGLIVGGIPVLYKKANVGKKRTLDLLYFVIGFAIILLMSFYNGTIVNLAESKGILNFIFLIMAGVIIAVALILPGISTSFMLLTLGLYDITIKAINNLEINYLVPIVIGAGLGVIATTKILERFLNDKPRATYLMILGFVIGSFIEVFPGIPIGLDILLSIITFIIGVILMRYMSIKYSE
jgi:putative membrane protein